jgi:hypothetical protein
LLVYFIIFYWIVRLQNITHFTYLICFTSFANLTNSNTVNFKTILFYAASFLLGMLLRWEVGVISFLISMAFFILYTPKNQWIKSVPIAIVVVLVSVYALFSFLRGKEFHNQIEPDGEYIVLYQKALRLPPHATALDSLKYEMLNNWIVDDTSLISIDYFKEAVAYAKSFKDRDYYLTKLKNGWGLFLIHLKKRWYLSLFFVIVSLFLAYFKKDFRFLIFLLFVYGIIIFIAYESLLTERHYFSILGGVFLFSLLNLKLYKVKSVFILVPMMLISAKLFSETNNNLYVLRKIQYNHEIFHSKLEQIMSNNLLFVDAQYLILFNVKTLKNTSFQNDYVIISFQQHSSSGFFQNMIKDKLDIEEYTICELFKKIKEIDKGVILMSYKRKITFEKIFKHCGLDIYFEEYQKLSDDIDTVNIFGTPVFWKLNVRGQ